MSKREDTPQYRKDYERGWRYYNRGVGSLDNLDRRGASEAVYDGFFDAAAGREKWHFLHHDEDCDLH